MEAQNWLAPDGGYKTDTSLGGNIYNPPYLSTDTANNNLFAIEENFLPSAIQNVLHKGKWEKWYPNIFQAYNGYVMPYKNKKNLYWVNYYEDVAQTKYRTAVMQFSNATDIDTLFKLVGHWQGGWPFFWNGKHMINVFSNGGEIVKYGPMCEITDTGLVKIDDPRWSFLANKSGGGIMYKNDLYFAFFGNPRIAVLKPDKWEVLQPGINGGLASVSTLLEYNKRLYFIGGFWKFEDPNNPGNSIAAWDGEKWDSLDGGATNIITPANGYFNSAVVCGGKLFLCGPFTHVGRMRASRIVSWNDTSWCTLGGDMDSTHGSINYLACLQDTLYATGDFSNVKGKSLGYVAKLVNINHVDSCGRPRYKIAYIPVEDFDFKYYPNPTKDKLTIEFMRDKMPIEKISIISSLGQIVFTDENPSPKVEIDVSVFSGAVYSIKLEGVFGQKFFKFVKE